MSWTLGRGDGYSPTLLCVERGLQLSLHSNEEVTHVDILSHPNLCTREFCFRGRKACVGSLFQLDDSCGPAVSSAAWWGTFKNRRETSIHYSSRCRSEQINTLCSILPPLRYLNLNSRDDKWNPRWSPDCLSSPPTLAARLRILKNNDNNKLASKQHVTLVRRGDPGANKGKCVSSRMSKVEKLYESNHWGGLPVCVCAYRHRCQTMSGAESCPES